MDFTLDSEFPGSQGKQVSMWDYLILTDWEEKLYQYLKHSLKQIYYSEYCDTFQNGSTANAEMFLRELFLTSVLNKDQG